jgi:hypothetical protein
MGLSCESAPARHTCARQQLAAQEGRARTAVCAQSQARQRRPPSSCSAHARHSLRGFACTCRVSLHHSSRHREGGQRLAFTTQRESDSKCVHPATPGLSATIQREETPRTQLCTRSCSNKHTHTRGCILDGSVFRLFRVFRQHDAKSGRCSASKNFCELLN